MSKTDTTTALADMITELNWRSLQVRRKDATLNMFYKIVNNIVAISNNRLQENNLKSDLNSETHYFHLQTEMILPPHSPIVEQSPCRYPVSQVC